MNNSIPGKFYLKNSQSMELLNIFLLPQGRIKKVMLIFGHFQQKEPSPLPVKTKYNQDLANFMEGVAVTVVEKIRATLHLNLNVLVIGKAAVCVKGIFHFIANRLKLAVQK